MSIKINTLEVQNVKRIKAIRIDMSGNALTVIGGKNKQGKTSVLDSIAFALGGGRYAPSNIKRDGSVADPAIKLTMSNGLIVERKGKNATLKVTDPAGNKTGQQLLNGFVSQLAIDLPIFMNGSDSEKAKYLLDILGIGAELEELERKERRMYDERHQVGQIADRKKKHAGELQSYDGVPKDLISASELIQQQQTILAKNGENQRKRDNVEQIKRNVLFAENDVTTIGLNLARMREELAKEESKLSESCDKVNLSKDDLADANKSAEQLQDESTAEIEKNLADVENINSKVRANLDKSKAEDDAKEFAVQYAELSDGVDAVRAQRIKLLESADLPLPGLTVEEGKLVYNSQNWDCMSGAEQLQVGTAIARKLNPNCGFVLLDKAEQFDLDTLREFGEWLEGEGLQAIATRVSTGDECSIIIEDGHVEGVDAFADTPTPPSAPKFEAGKF